MEPNKIKFCQMEVKQEVGEDTCKAEIDNNDMGDALFDTFKFEIKEEPKRESTNDEFDYLVFKQNPIKTEIEQDEYKLTLFEEKRRNEKKQECTSQTKMMPHSQVPFSNLEKNMPKKRTLTIKPKSRKETRTIRMMATTGRILKQTEIASTSQNDVINCFLKLLGVELRQIKNPKRCRLLRSKIMSLVYEAQEEEDNLGYIH
ncbi:uncharacterized protein [Diabrotica undecimpunctata]|uniref:uncharacterized protein isoform X3 n=1 Tax=Diabrotica undecimpunctata TaxID=50387 RepID=UPI003B63F67E